MSISWLDPQHSEDPLTLRRKHAPRDTMYMQTISAEDKAKHERTHQQPRDVMRNWHIDGSQPKPRTRERTRIPADYLEEVPGSKPRVLSREVRAARDGEVGSIIRGLGSPRKQIDRNTNDPLYSKPAGAPAAPRITGRHHVQHPKDAERGSMPSMVIPHPTHPEPEAPKFVRDSAAELTQVEGSHPKPPIDLSQPARNIMSERNEAVEGSCPGWRSRHQKEIVEKFGASERAARVDPMNVKDINEDGVFHSKRETNPLEPSYRFDDGDSQEIGSVPGSRPKPPPKPRDGPQPSLYTEDIQGPKKYVQARTGPRRDPRKLENDPKFTMEPTMLEPEEWIHAMKEARQAPVYGRKVLQSSAGVAGLIHVTPEVEMYPETPRSEADYDGNDNNNDNDDPHPSQIQRPNSVAAIPQSYKLRGPYDVPPLPRETAQLEQPAAGRPSSKVKMNKPRARINVPGQDQVRNSITGRPMTALNPGGGSKGGIGGAGPIKAKPGLNLGLGLSSTPRSNRGNPNVNANVPSDSRMKMERQRAEYNDDVESVRSLRF